MLDFAFSEDQERFRRLVRDFAERELKPLRRRWDQSREYPFEQMRKLLASGIPQEARRIGPTHVLRGIFAEEIARADFNCVYPLLPLWAGPGAPGGLGLPADVAGEVARGEKLQALAITEAEAGSDAGHIRTTAVRDGDEWVINGEKNTVSTLNADYFLVFARTGPLEEGARAVSGFLVPRDAAGVSVSEPYQDMGNRATPRGVLRLKDVRVPAANRLSGDPSAGPTGFAHIGSILDTNRAIIGLICLGAAQVSVEETVEYAKNRVVYGQPISRYQGVAFPLVEAYTLIEAARLLCYKTLWMADKGLRHTTEGAMIKWWVPRLAGDIIRECLTLHGHLGYTQDLPFEQRLRDVLGWEVGDGTAQISKLIVARALFGREAAPM